MYKTVFLEEKVPLTPSDMSKKENLENLESLLLERLRGKIENRCISSGYVKPQSLEILHRSMGTAENGRFTGNYLFFVKMRCKVFHPEANTPIECRVLKVNKMGAYAVFDEAMRILLPRDLHVGNQDFDKLNPDDVVVVNVLRSRFQTNDPFISSVGLFISRSATASGIELKVEDLKTVGAEED
jgi:DNA-directed RNA polymerase subunit E'/Rpb7